MIPPPENMSPTRDGSKARYSVFCSMYGSASMIQPRPVRGGGPPSAQGETLNGNRPRVSW
jgi:hypothetical protein